MKGRGFLLLAAAGLLAGLPACQSPSNQPSPQTGTDRSDSPATDAGPGNAPNPGDGSMPVPGADTNQGNGMPPMGGGR